MMASPDRPHRQPEHQRHRRPWATQGAAGRRARRAGQHGQPPHQLLGARPHRAHLRRAGRRGVRAWATPGPPRPGRRPPASTRSAASSPTSACSTSRRPTGPCACARSTPASPSTRSWRPPGSRWSIPDDVPETRLPTPEELELLRTVLDPGACATARSGVKIMTPRAAPPAVLATRVLRAVGVRYPIVQTGMGWVAGPRLVAATAEAGGLGILASATMTFDELVAPSPRSGPHRPALRGQPAHRRGRRR
jgi:hypothetical protein